MDVAKKGGIVRKQGRRRKDQLEKPAVRELAEHVCPWKREQEKKPENKHRAF